MMPRGCCCRVWLLLDRTQDPGAALINPMFLFNEVTPLGFLCCAVLCCAAAGESRPSWGHKWRIWSGKKKQRTVCWCIVTPGLALESQETCRDYSAHVLFLTRETRESWSNLDFGRCVNFFLKKSSVDFAALFLPLLSSSSSSASFMWMDGCRGRKVWAAARRSKI